MMDFSSSVNEFTEFEGVIRGGSSSLVLDCERGEIVRALVRSGQKGLKAEKAMVALRNHSEAERRRRERINGHLTTLRSLIPGTNKMDKASLLGEVINHLKELRQSAAEATKGILIPMDIDEVRVDQQEDGLDEESFPISASLCCEFKHEILCDLRQALEAIHLKTARAEIATLGSRMINLFVITSCEEGNVNDREGCQLLASSVQQALRSVLDKFHASQEFCASNTLSNKRRRVSFFNSSNSSPLGDFW
ncbi:hypothetical protein RJ639_030509 [Escallonia herrerae]|uniref:BHLH domain-containing protein n=1 Tax=Escallonia herrerae TaxID=1293975 RepID=A0AA89BC76_9ASTE|nr:hypothetical protein RJ639_030509 [Escallonia herrerae]